MATQVPIRCTITLTLVCDIDITQKSALKTKMTQIVTNLKTEYPDKIVSNRVTVDTSFASESWSV